MKKKTKCDAEQHRSRRVVEESWKPDTNVRSGSTTKKAHKPRPAKKLARQASSDSKFVKRAVISETAVGQLSMSTEKRISRQNPDGGTVAHESSKPDTNVRNGSKTKKEPKPRPAKKLARQALSDSQFVERADISEAAVEQLSICTENHTRHQNPDVGTVVHESSNPDKPRPAKKLARQASRDSKLVERVDVSETAAKQQFGLSCSSSTIPPSAMRLPSQDKSCHNQQRNDADVIFPHDAVSSGYAIQRISTVASTSQVKVPRMSRPIADCIWQTPTVIPRARKAALKTDAASERKPSKQIGSLISESNRKSSTQFAQVDGASLAISPIESAVPRLSSPALPKCLGTPVVTPTPKNNGNMANSQTRCGASPFSLLGAIEATRMRQQARPFAMRPGNST